MCQYLMASHSPIQFFLRCFLKKIKRLNLGRFSNIEVRCYISWAVQRVKIKKIWAF
jgi:hypothetical protein